MTEQKDNIDFVKKSGPEVKRHYRDFFGEKVDYWDEVYQDEDYQKDDLHGRMLNERMEHAIRMCVAGIERPLYVMDIGCGGGVLAKRLSHLGHIVYAVDHSHEMVVKTRQVSEGASKQLHIYPGVTDIEDLAFPGECFDRVTCLGVLMYLKSYDKAITEIRRVLKTGGIAVIAVSNRIRIDELLDVPLLLKKAIVHVFKKVRHLNKCIPYKFNNTLKENGFEILEGVSHGFGPFTLNGKVIFNNRVNFFVDRQFEKLRFLPVISRLGYTYIVKARKQGP